MPKPKSDIENKAKVIQTAIYILTLIGGLFAQYYALREAIHDEITERLASEKIIEFRLEALEHKISLNNHKGEPFEPLYAVMQTQPRLGQKTSRFKLKKS